MKRFTVEIPVEALRYDELPEADRLLVDAARRATAGSYSPYSGFAVGAAVRLDDGTVVCGANQENAAYPSGICAERTALFYAGASRPGRAVTALAVAARTAGGLTAAPVPPCGACRQVLLEAEARAGRPVRVLLSGSEETYVLEGAGALLPLSFGSGNLK